MFLLNHKSLQPRKQHLIKQLIDTQTQQYLHDDQYLWEIPHNVEITIPYYFRAIVFEARIKLCVDSNSKSKE